MVYPTLLAAISDVAHPAWRARSVGVYASGATAALPSGLCWPVLADLVSIEAAILAVVC